MLKLRIAESAERFRGEFSAWLKENPPPVQSDTSLESFIAAGRAWQSQLSRSKWIGVHWPVAVGGRGLSLVEEAIIQEELVRVNAPQLLGLFGLTMVGPVLIEHGTEEQKGRFLNRILTGEEVWCQGFSEPGAGSDLASIKTKAIRSGEEFVVSGQKTWTSFAHIAQWCFLLVRTGEEGGRHVGLTYLLVDMKSPGITVRPLRQISGDSEFNEVFFDEVRVPVSHVVGAIGEGWKIALSTLMYERVVLTFARQLQSEGLLRGLVKKYAKEGDEEIQAALASQIANACAVRALAYEHLLAYSNGKKPGPEGSLDKLFWSESFQSITHKALQLAGIEGAYGEGGQAAEAIHQYLYSRGRTIAAGTSEVQRGIIAERLLGLPRLSYRE